MHSKITGGSKNTEHKSVDTLVPHTPRGVIYPSLLVKRLKTNEQTAVIMPEQNLPGHAPQLGPFLSKVEGSKTEMCMQHHPPSAGGAIKK